MIYIDKEYHLTTGSWKSGRVVEGAALEKLYGSKAHHGFESHLFRQSLK